MRTFYIKIVIIFLSLAGLIITRNVKAGPGDTIHVQAFTFGSPQDAWFVFPSDTVRVEKILMKYKLKCNPAQSPACGEWDYLTYTFLYEHTGRLDSNLLYAPSYTIDASSPDSVRFMLQPSWSYFPEFNTQIHHTSVLSLDSTTIGTNNQPLGIPFNASSNAGKTCYLWKNNELTTNGLHAGTISSLSFFVSNTGGIMSDVTIRLKNSMLDSLNPEAYDTSGFTKVFHNNVSFTHTGWNKIDFTTDFIWADTSGICVEISYTNRTTGTDNILSGSLYASFNPCIYSSGNDRSLFFQGTDYVSVPAQAFAEIDSFITVSFWQYGNPAFQPQDQSSFEGLDSLNRRVINAHIPWSNGRVYWDAGFGSYDRIDQAAASQDYEGKWNFWAFTKNVKTGSMKIYLNGNLWLSGTGKVKRMYGIKDFKIGSFGNGGGNYDGYLNEFSIWNTELSADTIRAWMNRDITPAHPAYSKLKFYYKFDENSYTTATDSSVYQLNGSLTGPPVYSQIRGIDLNRNFKKNQFRPNIIFGQSLYTSNIDTLISIDSVQKQPAQISFYNDPLHPLISSGILMSWPVYYNHYTFDNLGRATDSVFVEPDSVIHLRKYPYYSTPFEVVNRYELARYITPYGNGLSLGNGFTWIYDVSDYRTLLHDSVHLSAGNWQELLDVEFEIIQGIPPRDPLRVTNLWCGDYGYNTNIESSLTPKKIRIDGDAANTRIKIRPTGHGFGGNENCAEFCAKNHMIFVNGSERFRKLVWKDDCAYNPVYPQGGTWVYQRANWCPGDIVPTFDFELTPYVIPGDSVNLDYNIDPYTWNGQGSYPTYVIQTQLVSYSAPNFTLDAAITDIKAPSNADIYKRINPVCHNPVITIKNTGSTPLTSLTVTYGVEGGTMNTYNWSGNLAFMQSEDVTLGEVNWLAARNSFVAFISAPNAGTDQYAYNNTMHTTYNFTPGYPTDLIFEYKTNNAPQENSYTLKDDQGNIILSKSSFTANTLYRDTVHLPVGCYELRFLDSDEDGLSWWANNDGAGYFRVRKVGAGTLKTFNSDFGAEIYHQFTAGYGLDIKEIRDQELINIYPNPSIGIINLDIDLNDRQNIIINIFDYSGNLVSGSKIQGFMSGIIPFDLSGHPAGIYFVRVIINNKIVNKKVVMMR